MALHTELPIYKACYDLVGVVMNLTTNMRRDYKLSLGKRIQDESMAALMLIFRANCASHKEPHITALLESIQVVELSIRLASDLRLISKKQYAAVIDLTGQVGKQANGWRKDSIARASQPAADIRPVQPDIFGHG